MSISSNEHGVTVYQIGIFVDPQNSIDTQPSRKNALINLRPLPNRSHMIWASINSRILSKPSKRRATFCSPPNCFTTLEN